MCGWVPWLTGVHMGAWGCLATCGGLGAGSEGAKEGVQVLGWVMGLKRAKNGRVRVGYALEGREGGVSPWRE